MSHLLQRIPHSEAVFSHRLTHSQGVFSQRITHSQVVLLVVQLQLPESCCTLVNDQPVNTTSCQAKVSDYNNSVSIVAFVHFPLTCMSLCVMCVCVGGGGGCGVCVCVDGHVWMYVFGLWKVWVYAHVFQTVLEIANSGQDFSFILCSY